LFLLGVLLVARPMVARAQDEIDAGLGAPSVWKLKSLRVGAAKLRTSLTNDPDTVWIGHIADPTWVPKDRNGANVPGVPAGGYGPYHVGRGENLPGGDVSSGVAGGA